MPSAQVVERGRVGLAAFGDGFVSNMSGSTITAMTSMILKSSI
jgi:hypothetical protein